MIFIGRINILDMHPRLEELERFLERMRAELLRSVERVPHDARDRRPDDGGWSVAEVLDHLRVVEAGTATLLTRRTQRAREAGVGEDPETSSVLARLDHARVIESPTLSVAPEIVRPREGVRAVDALTGLERSRVALREAVRALDGVDPTRVKAKHALLGELDAYQWLLFVGQHETRHARQIERIAAALRGD